MKSCFQFVFDPYRVYQVDRLGFEEVYNGIVNVVVLGESFERDHHGTEALGPHFHIMKEIYEVMPPGSNKKSPKFLIHRDSFALGGSGRRKVKAS